MFRDILLYIGFLFQTLTIANIKDSDNSGLLNDKLDKIS